MIMINTCMMRNDFKCNHFRVNDIDSHQRGRAGQKFRAMPAKDRRLSQIFTPAKYKI